MECALACSASATIALVRCRQMRWGKTRSPKLPMIWSSSWCSGSSKRNRSLRTVALSATAGFGSTMEAPAAADAPRLNYIWPDNKRPRVCIVGGGFGGLYTALRLESLVWPDGKKPQVVLIDQSERFVFKPMLYELLSGEVETWEIAPQFSDLLANTDVRFLKDRVKCLYPCDHLGTNAPTAGTVHLESGLLIEYDWLVLAIGAEAKLDIVPGAADYALPFYTLDDALRVDKKLKELERKNFGKDSAVRVAVVGCGYGGVELAATISERLKEKGIVQAINVEKTVLPNAPAGNREAALKVLLSRKVQLLLGYFVRCIKKEVESQTSDAESKSMDSAADHSESIILELQPAERGLEGQIITADIVLWTIGSKPLLPELEPSDKPYDIPLNARGQAETDETLRVKGHPRIFAVGDSSALRDENGKVLPATAQVAFQQADFAGWNLWAAINDRPLLPFRYQNLGEMMTLGRHDAAVSPSFTDGLTLEGFVGHTARKVAYLIRLPTDQHRVKVGISWLLKSTVDSVATVQTMLAKAQSGS
ncbi:alternative NAD(P)H-ubiquinone oxidoreductase C1, chloroplastic/mitochondrial-like [Nicotiana tabacum]|uniref:demethylphylloquinone reductase n=2 Tax=Nicotiana TaxID=4085 RepID=A0A1S4AE11_TOBAC|nr:PREDICTED: alternative NAD(P)H-ubiquinone oxidoreductase C1, chloroplastic/mitochondrial [Nicotiana sylvestris]XP_016474703.1 PREDICTED: alternative NAD(P)H-ubiquinone oxidoreductase C1, chloroplastic/mitochondrial-like [Nicotiana tabacum]